MSFKDPSISDMINFITENEAIDEELEQHIKNYYKATRKVYKKFEEVQKEKRKRDLKEWNQACNCNRKQIKEDNFINLPENFMPSRKNCKCFYIVSEQKEKKE